MLKPVFFTIMFLFSAFSTWAQSSQLNGVLQAYWLPVWDQNGLEYTSQLKYRYFVSDNGEKAERIINLYADKNTSAEAQLNHYFSSVPPAFLTWKEGHIEQAGALSVDNLMTSTECDHRYFSARMVHFNPADKPSVDIHILEKNAGCDAFPWIMTYTLKAGLENKYFKQQPDAGAKDLQPVPPGSPLVKIKTINSHWIQVAVRDENKPGLLGEAGGYIKLDDLQPIN